MKEILDVMEALDVHRNVNRSSAGVVIEFNIHTNAVEART